MGQVVDIVGGLIHLRPLDGGPVWARDRRAVRAVTTEEGISAKLNARNRASRSGR
ncbi:hypothetical protein ACGF5F_29480 [Streptomyces sp. NPDC047821]|uniref:hypothetical protein n=1 Tax=Streptomyces sp. NPDC047821 TaxID=3365488 RepID=UPI0037204922